MDMRDQGRNETIAAELWDWSVACNYYAITMFYLFIFIIYLELWYFRCL